MKPIYYLFFLLLTLYACTDQQTDQEASSHSLRFGVEEVDETKGVVTTTHNIRSMSVFCAHTGVKQYSSTATCNWMHNAGVTRMDENSEWIVQGSVNKQWKDEGYHSFFAFAPYAPEGAVVSQSSVAGPPIMTYTVPADYSKQVDLLYSHKTLVNGKQMYIGSRPVSFGFRHALSKITFEVAKAAEVDVNTYFAIEKISLRNIHNTGALLFNMDSELKQVTGAAWSIVDQLGNYSVESQKGLKWLWTLYQMLPVSEEGQALFVLPQKINESAIMEISFTESTNGVLRPNRVLEVKLSDLLSDFQLGKAYRFSIVLKEDRVSVVAQIQPWEDQSVDGSVSGTYLNLSASSISVNQGTPADIYYSTDGTSVKGMCDKDILLQHDSKAKKFTFPSTAAVGDYIATITAGKLIRNIVVKVKKVDFVKIGNLFWATGNLVADGLNSCKVGNPEDGGLYFQWGSLIGWTGGKNGDGTGKPNASVSLAQKVKPSEYNGNTNWSSSWSGYIVYDIPLSGYGDPCRYYLKDGWRLPNFQDYKELRSQGFDIPANCSVGKWHGSDINNRAWFEYAGFRANLQGVLTLTSSNWEGTYWSFNSSSYECRYFLFSLTMSDPGIEDKHSLGYPIRCVKPAP